MALAAVIISVLACCVNAYQLLMLRRLRRASKRLAEASQPIIHMPGTLTPEAEAKLRERFERGVIRRTSGDVRL